jgi:hypothetical protein
MLSLPFLPLAVGPKLAPTPVLARTGRAIFQTCGI